MQTKTERAAAFKPDIRTKPPQHITPSPYNGHDKNCLCCMCQQLCQDQGHREIPGFKPGFKQKIVEK